MYESTYFLVYILFHTFYKICFNNIISTARFFIRKYRKRRLLFFRSLFPKIHSIVIYFGGKLMVSIKQAEKKLFKFNISFVSLSLSCSPTFFFSYCVSWSLFDPETKQNKKYTHTHINIATTSSCQNYGQCNYWKNSLFEYNFCLSLSLIIMENPGNCVAIVS